jgi:hypothetical protein
MIEPVHLDDLLTPAQLAQLARYLAELMGDCWGGELLITVRDHRVKYLSPRPSIPFVEGGEG